MGSLGANGLASWVLAEPLQVGFEKWISPRTDDSHSNGKTAVVKNEGTIMAMSERVTRGNERLLQPAQARTKQEMKRRHTRVYHQTRRSIEPGRDLILIAGVGRS